MEFAPRPEFFPLCAEDLATVGRLVGRGLKICGGCTHYDLEHPINHTHTAYCNRLHGWRKPWEVVDCRDWTDRRRTPHATSI